MSETSPATTNTESSEEFTERITSAMSFLWSGTNPADNPEYLRGMVELAADLIGYDEPDDGDNLREVLTAAVCSGS